MTVATVNGNLMIPLLNWDKCDTKERKRVEDNILVKFHEQQR